MFPLFLWAVYITEDWNITKSFDILFKYCLVILKLGKILITPMRPLEGDLVIWLQKRATPNPYSNPSKRLHFNRVCWYTICYLEPKSVSICRSFIGDYPNKVQPHECVFARCVYAPGYVLACVSLSSQCAGGWINYQHYSDVRPQLTHSSLCIIHVMLITSLLSGSTMVGHMWLCPEWELIHQPVGRSGLGLRRGGPMGSEVGSGVGRRL